MGTNSSVLSYEMNKINVDEKWREQVEAQQREIADLRAQLAAMVTDVQRAMDACDDAPVKYIENAANKMTRNLSTIISKTSEDIKADAEVLRCAESYFDALKNNPDQVDFSDYLVDLEDAVRAAKEAKDGRTSK